MVIPEPKFETSGYNVLKQGLVDVARIRKPCHWVGPQPEAARKEARKKEGIKSTSEGATRGKSAPIIRSVTLQRTVDKRFGDPSFVTEYVGNFNKKQSKSTHKIFDKRTGRKPEWLEKIENAPAPKIDDEALLNTRKASLFKEEFQNWKGAKPTESIQMQLRDQEYDKIRLDAGKTKLDTVTTYEADMNSAARKWQARKPFDREANINTMSSYNNPKGREAKMLYATSKNQDDYPYWGTSAFSERRSGPDTSGRLTSKFTAESEYKGHFRNTSYGRPEPRKADRSIPPSIAPIQNETTYSSAFTKATGASAPRYGTLAARELLEPRRNWHTSPAQLAPDEMRRGQERTKIQWSGKKKGYTIYKSNRSPYFSIDTKAIDDVTEYRVMTNSGPKASLQQTFVPERTRDAGHQILSEMVTTV